MKEKLKEKLTFKEFEKEVEPFLCVKGDRLKVLFDYLDIENKEIGEVDFISIINKYSHLDSISEINEYKGYDYKNVLGLSQVFEVIEVGDGSFWTDAVCRLDYNPF